jgi:hypothetical protein
MKTWDQIRHPEWAFVTNPVLHDKSTSLENSEFCLRTNNQYWASSCSSRRTANFGGLTQAKSLDFIHYTYDQLRMDADGSSRIVGDVNMQKYLEWLQTNYGLAMNRP